MKRVYYLLISLLIAGSACRQAPKDSRFLPFIPADTSALQYQGRIGIADSSAKVLYWSGSSVKIAFQGSGIAAWLKDENFLNYFNVIVDGKVQDLLRPDTVKNKYTLVSDLPEGRHTLELFKRTEWTHGKTWFYGFEPLDAEILEELPLKTRRIEFYGNSITAGYAVEDTTGGDSPDSTYTNFYKSYAALIARRFNANYSAIVRSGIGITVSWSHIIMSEICERIDPTDSTSQWNFANNQQPDVVVVNLLQNDSWLTTMRDHPQHKKRFASVAPSIEYVTARYQDFIRDLRGKYPAAHIICMLGNMDITKEGSPWPEQVKQVVEALKDPMVYPLFIPYKNTPGHPREAEQKIMADALGKLIAEKTGWK